MRVADFSFELPESLIAHYPMPERSSCRLAVIRRADGALTHGTFTDLLRQAQPRRPAGFNNTRVIPARLFGRKASGGKIECWSSVCSMINVFWHIFARLKRRNPAPSCCLATMRALKQRWLHATTRCLKWLSTTRAAYWIFSTLSAICRFAAVH